MSPRQGPWLLQFWADGTGTPLVQVHYSRGQLHRKRIDQSHPEISKAGYLLTRPCKSHFGVRDLCTGGCHSKDLINSDKTGLDLILLPVLYLRVFEIMDL